MTPLEQRLAEIEARRKAAHEDPEADYVDYADFLDDSTGFLLSALRRAMEGLHSVEVGIHNEEDILADLERLASSSGGDK